MRSVHIERHLIERIGWLRAAVLGANDGIISTASLIVGVAAASNSLNDVLVAGVAGLVAGAAAMAAGEYVSVSSQADTEAADLNRERRELAEQPEAELKELAHIYEQRGLDSNLALQVATQLTSKGAFEAHARDELGWSAHNVARPIQAAFTSALMFSVGAALPLLVTLVSPLSKLAWFVSGGSLVALALLGAIGAKAGGVSIYKPMLRVTFWGAIAMGVTAAIGRLVGHAL